jgi:hypothetical protein
VENAKECDSFFGTAVAFILLTSAHRAIAQHLLNSDHTVARFARGHLSGEHDTMGPADPVLEQREATLGGGENLKSLYLHTRRSAGSSELRLFQHHTLNLYLIRAGGVGSC